MKTIAKTKSPTRCVRVAPYLLASSSVFVAGIGVIFYQGPARAFVRGHLGDLLVVMLIYFLISMVWETTVRWRSLAVLLFAALVELAQLLPGASSRTSMAAHLTVGTTFDWVDLAMYALGVVAVVLLEMIFRPDNSTGVSAAS